MKGSLLQVALGVLSKEEVKRFGLFLQSPYFNRKKAVTAFGLAIIKHHPAVDLSEPERDRLYKQVFKKEYHAANYRNLCMDVYREVLQFIELEHFLSTGVNRRRYLLDRLRERHSYDLMERVYKRAEQEWSSATGYYRERLKDRLWLNDQKVFLAIQRHRIKPELVATVMSDPLMLKQVMDFSLSKALIYLINEFRAHEITGEPFDMGKANQILSIYENKLCSDNVFVESNYLSADLIIRKNLDSYDRLKAIVLEPGLISFPNDRENLLIALLNFVISIKDRYEGKWQRELFDLYVFRLESGLWNLFGELSFSTVFNAVEMAVILGEFDYARRALDRYSGYMNIEVRDDFVLLCQAMIALYEGKIDEAHRLILPIRTKNIILKYEIRTIQAMIYFQSRQYAVLLSYLESFKDFLQYNRTKVEYNIFKGRMNFCSFLEKLLHLRLKPNRLEEREWLETIRQSQVEQKIWLMRQAEV